ncbi:MAG TPA: hypothetical protein VIY09_05340 [Rhizomicrobium sp.]
MNRHARLRVGAAASLVLSLLSAGRPAHAGSTATRCDAQGCIHIHCNSTGDRCYRYEDPRPAPDAERGCADCSADEGRLAAAVPGHGRSLCDSNGDRCYYSASARWDYREYYRRQGYHWDTQGR